MPFRSGLHKTYKASLREQQEMKKIIDKQREQERLYEEQEKEGFQRSIGVSKLLTEAHELARSQARHRLSRDIHVVDRGPGKFSSSSGVTKRLHTPASPSQNRSEEIKDVRLEEDYPTLPLNSDHSSFSDDQQAHQKEAHDSQGAHEALPIHNMKSLATRATGTAEIKIVEEAHEDYLVAGAAPPFVLFNSPGRQDTSVSPSPGTGMSSSVETTSDDDEVDCAESMEIHKSMLLVRLLLKVHEMFTPKLVCRGGRSDSPSSGSKSRQCKQATTSSSSSSSKGKKRARDRGEEAEDRNEKLSDDEHGEGKEGQDIASASNPQRRLACPYFKRNPRQRHPSRACSGPGWETMARVKEHLYRKHRMPIYCPRCRKTFSYEEEVEEHSRSSDICQVNQTITFAGFTRDQEKRLRSRSEMHRARSEEEKWKIVYLILFVDVALGDIPIPYYGPEDASSGKNSKHDTPQSSDILDYNAYLRRELPRRIRRKLEDMIDEEISGPAEELILSKLEAIVRDCQENTIQDYQAKDNFGTSSQEEQPSRSQETLEEESVFTRCDNDMSWMNCDPVFDPLSDWGMLPLSQSFDDSLNTLLPDGSYSDDFNFLINDESLAALPKKESQQRDKPSYVGKGKGRA